MKLKTLLFLFFCLFVVTKSFAYIYGNEINGICYWLDTSEETARVTYKEGGYSGFVNIPYYVTDGDKTFRVTGIVNGAFIGCSDLTDISIPSSVTTIGSHVFSDCTRLTSVTFPNSVTTIGDGVFSGCIRLISVSIGFGVTSIGSGFSNGCVSLERIFVNSGNLKYNSRDNCNAIVETETNKLIAGCKSSHINLEVQEIGSYAFYGSGLSFIIIPNNVKKIDLSAFQDCKDLTKVVLDCDAFVSKTSHIGDYFGEQVKEYVIGNNVTSIPNYAFYCCSGQPSFTIGNNVKSIGWYAFCNCSGMTSVNIGNSVTSIGHFAFCNCSGLKSVAIGNSVTSIGSYAFEDCSSLTSLTIPNSVTSIEDYAFCDCSGLTSLTIGNSVTSIGKGAFSGCSGLQKVIVPDIAAWCGIKFERDTSNPLYYARHLFKDETTEITDLVIPNSVTSIGNYAFWGCSGLKSVTIPNSVTSIGYDAFYDCSGLTSLTIGNSVTAIGGYAFYNCTGLKKIIVPDIAAWCGIEFGDYYANPLCYAHHLFRDETKEITNVVIPDGMKSIGDYSFSGCSGLTNVSIPKSVTSIGDGAFNGCIALTSLTIPNSVTGIGNSAFYGCSSLTSLTIGNSVIRIGGYAFSGCSGLTSVTIPKSVIEIGDEAFSDCAGLASVIIPNTVENIRKGTFSGCSGLTSVAIPSSVRGIGEYAFRDCSGLTSIIIPNRVISIRDYAFYGCNGLTSIIIPNSVTYIGEYVFFGCSGLNDVYCMADNVPSTNSYAFNSSTIASATLHVPESSLETYRTTAPWSDFGTIVAIGESPAIAFADANVKAICIANWDTNGDGELSEAEAAAVTDLGMIFKEKTTITSFNELRYFTRLTSIGDYAFSGCRSLTSVAIPESVTSIGGDAFYNCTGLKKVIVSDIVAWCSILFKNYSANPVYYSQHIFSDEDTEIKDLVIPEGVTTIGGRAFQKCSGITSVAIPNSVISIGDYALAGTSLKSLTISGNVTAIGDGAFNACSSLTSITVETGNTKYDSRNNCNAIIETETNTLITGCQNTVIPESVTSIGNSAFYNCSGLASITIPNSVTSIGDAAFYNCSRLTNVTIPNSVTSIGDFAFDVCTALTSVTIPEGVIYFGSYAFRDCTGLTSVTISNGVTYIGYYAFQYCSNLTSISIPESVTSIGSYAFYYCSGLTSITCNAMIPPSCGNRVFYGVDKKKCNLLVPAGSEEAYRTADPWRDFYNIIDIETPVNSLAEDRHPDTIYDLNGRKLPERQKGLNIIRMNDGTMKKVLLK